MTTNCNTFFEYSQMMLKFLILALSVAVIVQAQDGKLDDAGLDKLIDGVLSKGAAQADDIPKVSHLTHLN